MPMGPTCTVMVYYRSCRLDLAKLGPQIGQAAGKPVPRLLTQPITLIRDLHCIRAAEAYFTRIKADRATPHPPTPRRPVR